MSCDCYALRPLLPRMAEASAEWDALADAATSAAAHWDKLEATLSLPTVDVATKARRRAANKRARAARRANRSGR